MSIKILLTTPDYPPKLGGLSTFTSNLESILRQMGEVTLHVWDNVQQLTQFNSDQHFDWGIHVHFMGGVAAARFCKKNLNFIHGSEVAFTSPNFIKRTFKKIMKRKFISYLEESHWNLFISEFTRQFLVSKGLESDFSRDLVFHNLIDLKENQLFGPSFTQGPLQLVCIARDVPHKNIDGAITIAKNIQNQIKREVVLTINAMRDPSLHSNIKMVCLPNLSNEEREKIYQKSHFNLLPSLDFSSSGFFEGFGLTVLEAGKYGTPSIVFSDQGGQGESVHHRLTGWSDLYSNREQIPQYISEFDEVSYQQLRVNTFQHTIDNHDKNFYKALFDGVLK